MIWRMRWLSAVSLANLACGAMSVSVTAEELRDPFVFGSRGPEAKPSVQPTLIGVLWDTRKPLAMIGEYALGIGETIAGWTVVEIQQGSVTLQRAHRSVTLIPGNTLPAE